MQLQPTYPTTNPAVECPSDQPSIMLHRPAFQPAHLPTVICAYVMLGNANRPSGQRPSSILASVNHAPSDRPSRPTVRPSILPSIMLHPAGIPADLPPDLPTVNHSPPNRPQTRGGKDQHER